MSSPVSSVSSCSNTSESLPLPILGNKREREEVPEVSIDHEAKCSKPSEEATIAIPQPHTLSVMYQLTLYSEENVEQFVDYAQAYFKNIKRCLPPLSSSFVNFFNDSGIDLDTPHGWYIMKEIFLANPDFLFDFVAEYHLFLRPIVCLNCYHNAHLLLSRLRSNVSGEKVAIVAEKEKQYLSNIINNGRLEVEGLLSLIGLSRVFETEFARQILGSPITGENCREMLVIGIGWNNLSVIDQCVEFINTISLDFSFSRRGNLIDVSVNRISDPVVEFLDFCKLHCLQDNMSVILFVRMDSLQDALKNFTEQFSSMITRVEFLVLCHENIIRQIILSCPRISALSITGSALSTPTLEAISRLPHLAELSLDRCTSDADPLSLTTISCLGKFTCQSFSLVDQLLLYIHSTETNRTAWKMDLVDHAKDLVSYIVHHCEKNIQNRFVQIVRMRKNGDEALAILELLALMPKEHHIRCLDLVVEQDTGTIGIKFILERYPDITQIIHENLKYLTTIKFHVLCKYVLVVPPDWCIRYFLQSLVKGQRIYSSTPYAVFDTLLGISGLFDRFRNEFPMEEQRNLLIELKKQRGDFFSHSLFHYENLEKYILELFPLDIPENASLYPFNNTQSMINCVFHYPMMNPSDCLYKIGMKKSLLGRIQVHYIGQEGFDGGALRRDFFTRLLHSFSNQFHLMTAFPECRNREQEVMWRGLGYSLSYCYWNGILLDEVFASELWRWMLSFSFDQLKKSFDGLSERELFFLTHSLVQDDPAIGGYADSLYEFIQWTAQESTKDQVEMYKQRMVEFSEWGGIDLPRGRWHYTKVEDFQLAALHNFNDLYRNRWRALHCIASRLQMTSEGWSFFRESGAAGLIAATHGDFDKEALMRKVKFVEPVREEIKAAVSRWITGCPEDKLREFLRYTTGSTVLPQQEISISLIDTIVIPQTAACTQTIWFPATITPDDVERHFDAFCDESLAGFNNR